MTNNSKNPDTFDINPNTNTRDDVDRLAAVLAETRRQVSDLGHVVEEMEARLVRARGTGDITEQARAAVAQVTPQAAPAPSAPSPSVPEYLTRQTPQAQLTETPTRRRRRSTQNIVTIPTEPTAPGQDPLPTRIERALRQESMTISKLCRVVGSSPGAVTDVLKNMRREQRIYNVGSQDYPLWTYRIGDETDTNTLTNTIRRLISERPMTTRELVDATGARMTRVSGVMVQLLRGSDQILNMSHSRFGRWFLVDDRAKSAKLVDPRKV